MISGLPKRSDPGSVLNWKGCLPQKSFVSSWLRPKGPPTLQVTNLSKLRRLCTEHGTRVGWWPSGRIMDATVQRKLTWFLRIFLFLSVFFIFFLSPGDNDLGWHLRYGDYFLEHGRPLMKNTLSVLMAGYRWPNSYILYQPLVAFVYRNFSFWGLSALNALLFVFSFGAVFLYFRKRVLPTLAVLVVTTLGGWIVFQYGLRAQMMSFFFLALLVYVLKYIKSRGRRVLTLLALFALWGNFHSGFPLGIFLVGLWQLSELVRDLLAGRSFRELTWATPLLCVAAAVAAPLLNPYGIGNYLNVLQHFKTPMATIIAEWLPPNGSHKFALAALFGIYLYGVFASRRWREHLFWLPASAALLYLALTSRRNLPFFFLVQSMSLVELIPRRNRVSEVGSRRWSSLLAVPLLWVVLFYGLAFQLPQAVRRNTNWDDYCREGVTELPRAAVAFAQETGLRGAVFSMYKWGGFLIWQLPENKVFVDGRMPAWPHPLGISPYTVYLDIIQAGDGYQATLDSYGISWLLIGSGSFLDLELQDGDGGLWREVHRDPLAVIYTMIE